MNALTSAGVDRARPRKTRWRPSGSHSHGATAQPHDARFDLLALLAAQDVFAPALVSFGLPDVLAERLALDPEILATCAIRRPDSNTSPVPRSSNSFEYFLACAISRDFSLHQAKPWPRNLHQTQDGSLLVGGAGLGAGILEWGNQLVGVAIVGAILALAILVLFQQRSDRVGRTRWPGSSSQGTQDHSAPASSSRSPHGEHLPGTSRSADTETVLVQTRDPEGTPRRRGCSEQLNGHKWAQIVICAAPRATSRRGGARLKCRFAGSSSMELARLELATSWVRSRRSPN
jgi:hypothetical protein